jgi:hypothetical protein
MDDNLQNEAEALIAATIHDAEQIGEPIGASVDKVVADPAKPDEAIGESCCDAGGRRPKQADLLIDLARSAQLFHAPDGRAFADLNINGHRETWGTGSEGFRQWLSRLFYEATGGAPSSEAYQSALNVIEGKARFEGPERIIHIRVGGLDGRLYLDLADKKWRAVEIDSNGWRLIENPPVRFRRPSGMKPLPQPVSDQSRRYEPF